MFAHSIDVAPAAIHTPPAATVARWSTATRIAFRFCLVYFGLYVVCTQMLGGLLVLPVGGVPQFGRIPPMSNLTSWVATQVFGMTRALVITGSGSGDKTFDWVQAFCLLVSLASTVDKTAIGRFAFQQPDATRLILDGDMNGHAIRMQTHLVDRNSFLLVNRGFHWIQEYPFNR